MPDEDDWVWDRATARRATTRDRRFPRSDLDGTSKRPADVATWPVMTNVEGVRPDMTLREVLVAAEPFELPDPPVSPGHV
jgi:hypothetical protein